MKTITKIFLMAVVSAAILTFTSYVSFAQFPFTIGTPGGTAVTSVGGMTTDGSSNTYVTGIFQGTSVNFDPSGLHTMTSSGSGANTDQYVVKYDAAGRYVWSLRIQTNITGSSGVGVLVNNSMKGIAVDASNHLYITGSFSGTAGATFYDANNATTAPVSGGVTATLSGGNGTNNGGAGDVFVAQYDISGALPVLNWRFRISSPGTDVGVSCAAKGSSLAVTGSFGGAVTGGGATLTFYGINDVATGNTLVGGAAGASGTGTDCFAAQYTSSGSYSWSVKGVGTTNVKANVGLGIAFDGSGNVFVEGQYGTSGNGGATIVFSDASTPTPLTSPGIGTLTGAAGIGCTGAFIVKFNSSGVYQQIAHVIGTVGANPLRSYGIVIDNSDNIIIVEKNANVSHNVFDKTQTNVKALTAAAGNAGAIVKFDNTLGFLWIAAMAGNTQDQYGIATDGSNIFITGTFTTTNALYDASNTSVFTLPTSVGAGSVHLAKYNSAGTPQWGLALNASSGTTFTEGTRITTDACGNPILGGVFKNTLTFYDKGTSGSLGSALGFAPTAVGIQDAFIVKYDASGAAQISSQPANISVCPGNNANFTVTAPGATAWQWQESTDGGNTWSNTSDGGSNPAYSGSATASLTLTTVPSTYGGYRYRAVITSGSCPLISSVAVLSSGVGILTQPASPPGVCPSGFPTPTATFAVSASGAGTISYKWQESTDGGSSWANVNNGGVYSGTATNSMTISSPGSSMNGYKYRVVVSSSSCVTSINSNGVATLTVFPLPSISVQPSAASACVNTGSAVFSVVTDATTFQWIYGLTPACSNPSSGCNATAVDGIGTNLSSPGNTLDISGATTNTLTLSNFNNTAYNGFHFAVILYSSHGCVTSSSNPSPTLTIKTPPVISTQPTNPSSVCPGTGAPSFTVAATGGTPFTYQWQESADGGSSWANKNNGGVYSGATTATLTITAPPISMNGYKYRAVVSGCSPSATSDGVATLTVGPAVGGLVTPATAVVCGGGSRILTVSGANGGTLQWQSSTDNITWNNISGQTNTTYNAAPSQKTYYRSLTVNASCYNIASTTATVDIAATPVVSIINVTSSSATVTWSPYGSGQYDIVWSGAGTNGTATGVTTNTFNISNLPSTNTPFAVSVTQTTPGSCSPPITMTGVASSSTLCGVPTLNNLVAVAGPAHGFTANWTLVSGATAYRVYYRGLITTSSWSFVDVGNVSTKTVNVLYGNETYAVYVTALNCPNPGNTGDPSGILYVTTNPISTCDPPTVTGQSNCPNQITINITGGTAPYIVTLRRLSPSVTAGASYTLSTGTFNVNVGTQYAGTTWEVFARSKCGGTIGYISNVLPITVKPGCATLQNLVLSHPTCHGFSASWNANDCAGLGTNYQLLIKRNGTTTYNGYPQGSDHGSINSLQSNTFYDVVVMSVACNGATSSYSNMQTIQTSACREELQSEADATITQSKDEAVNIYPNPTQGQFWVYAGSRDNREQMVKIELVNPIGQVVQTDLSTMTGGHMEQLINTPSGIATGIYFVRVSVGSSVYVNKLMITK